MNGWWLAVCVGVGVLYGQSAEGADSRASRASQRPIVESYGPDAQHTMKIWSASGASPAPVLVHFHAGGFKGGRESGGPLQDEMQKAGVTVVGATYRFFTNGITRREVMEDGARVVQYLRYHASRLNIDPNRIAVSGSSAGGSIAAFVAYHDDLADPSSSDPVLRESSRVNACALSITQTVPLTLDDWVTTTGLPAELLATSIVPFVQENERLNGSLFRDPIDRGDYATDEDYLAARDDYMRDIYAFYQVTLEDPPLCILSRKNSDPVAYTNAWRGQQRRHSPLLMIPIYRKATSLGIPTAWTSDPQGAAFMYHHLQIPVWSYAVGD